MAVQLRSFLAPTPEQYLALVTAGPVRRHLPLGDDRVTRQWCVEWMRAVQRWGFVADGVAEIDGTPFHRFVLRP